MRVDGAKIRALRTANGWNQRELGERVGAREARVGCWERGQVEPSLTHLIKVARALGVTAEGLVRDD
ncbi:DNA-binding XRE family transcriptional regulator [Haloactinospora alba]|uniref:DNA-binding XRE family transcriptional regulator n=1 Tax=Haloactinospora alba TaxID=405555 RepID=A0A543NG18_9ACTN|nr:helix-turn-helix transcriptional regulator [Haloactinospora alba]TQN30743.1 DNA-binding XRE family transcriptional regulator [Haloactinospora alba]